MRHLFLVFAVYMIALTSAHAISQFNTKGLSCSSVQTKLKSHGIALLRYPAPHNKSITMYDYYVPDNRRCSTGGFGHRATIPASDTRSCHVHRCVRRPSNHGGG